jgi:hypothetical protein
MGWAMQLVNRRSASARLGTTLSVMPVVQAAPATACKLGRLQLVGLAASSRAGGQLHAVFDRAARCADRQAAV